MTEQGFPKDERLRKSEDISRVIREGSRVRGKLLDARWRARESPGEERNRVGIGASRRIGNAVLRNHLKRRIREAYRRNKEVLACRGMDIVFLATVRMHGRGMREIEGDMRQLLSEIAAGRPSP